MLDTIFGQEQFTLNNQQSASVHLPKVVSTTLLLIRTLQAVSQERKVVPLTKIVFSQVNADLHQVYANLVYLHSGLCRFTPALQVCFHLMYIRNVKMCRDLRSKSFFMFSFRTLEQMWIFHLISNMFYGFSCFMEGKVTPKGCFFLGSAFKKQNISIPIEIFPVSLFQFQQLLHILLLRIQPWKCIDFIIGINLKTF